MAASFTEVLPFAAWLEACTASQLFALKAEFDYKAFFLRVFETTRSSG